MRLLCLFLPVLLVNISTAQTAESDCWEQSGDAAISACSKIINFGNGGAGNQKSESVSRAHFYRGNAFFLRRDYRQAIADYDAAIRLDPNFIKAYHIRGNAYFLLEDYEQALANFDQVIQLDPNYSEVTFYRERALKLLQQNR